MKASDSKSREDKKQHQRRVFSFVRVLEDLDVLEVEKAIPEASRYVDSVLHFGEASAGWSVLQPMLSHRTVVLEHYCKAPTQPELATARFKLAWCVDEWWNQKPDKRYGDRPPLLLLLVSGRSVRALGAFPGLVAGPLSGIWCRMEEGLGDVVLVDMKGLEPADGTSILRLMHTPGDENDIRQRYEHLMTDPGVDHTLRETIMEAAMDGRLDLPQEERDFTYQGALRAGRAEGRAEGEAAGLAKAILTVFDVREMEVPVAVRARIEECKDLELLETWQRRAVKVDVAEEIFAE